MNKVVAGAIGVAAGVVGGIALGVAMRPVGFSTAKHNAINGMDRAYDNWTKERAGLKKGETTTVFGEVPNPGDYNGVGRILMFPLAVGAIGGGGFLAASKPGAARIAGAALMAIGGAIMGAAIGAISGHARGEEDSDARHGIDIAAQAANVVQTFDLNANKTLEIDDGGRIRGEFSLNIAPGRGWAKEQVSIQKFVTKADVDNDQKVNEADLKALLSNYDTNKNGLLSRAESKAYFNDGLEAQALKQVGH